MIYFETDPIADRRDRLNPIQGGGGQKRLRAPSSLNFYKNKTMKI